MENTKRLGIVALIVVSFLLLGILLNFGWNRAEEATHPIKYEEIVAKYADEYGIPETLIFAIIKVESDFDATATSSAGAIGLMQMMPSTFEWLTGEEHLREYLPSSSLLLPEVSIRYGVYYLSYLYQKFDCNQKTALAAYNGGEGNVAKWLKDPDYSDGNGNLTYIPFEETRSYVSKVLDAEQTYQKIHYESKE